MKIKRVADYFQSILLLFLLPSAGANPLPTGSQTIDLSPQHGAQSVCPDTPLNITFNSAPVSSRKGALRIFSKAGGLVETIDSSAPLSTKTIAGVAVTNYSLMISSNTATFFPQRKLELGTTYYVTVDPEIFSNAPNLPALTNDGQWSFTTRTATPPKNATNLIVAADGSGDFCTIQSAIDFLPENNQRPVRIFIRKGIYREIIGVVGKHNITFSGEDRDKTLITYPNNANLNNSVWRALFNVEADDITLENLSLRNSTPKGGSQAEALRNNGQRCILFNANFSSFQDTLKLNGSVYAENCFVEGDVDFIWGSGTAFFYRCEIKALNKGYNCQSRNNASGFGEVFVDCKLTSAAGVTNHVLARVDPNVYPFSHVAYINCAMGAHISAAGWKLNHPGPTDALQWWEFRSTDLAGKLLDISQRAPFSRQLTSQEADTMRNATHVLRGWNPRTRLLEKR